MFEADVELAQLLRHGVGDVYLVKVSADFYASALYNAGGDTDSGAAIGNCIENYGVSGDLYIVSDGERTEDLCT